MVFLLSENRKYYVYVIAITLILVLTITPILCNNTTNTNGVLVKDIVTDTFFSEVANRSDIVIKCKGNRGFFNRWAFLQALDSFPQFGTVGSKDDSAREIAAFFAHVTHDIDAADICSDDDQVGLVQSNGGCDSSNSGYPCNPIPDDPWRMNRKSPPSPISSLNNHDTSDDQSIQNNINNNININEVLFNRLLGFWMNNNCHNAMTSGQGFGATIRAITTSRNMQLECNGLNPTAIISRVQLYTNYCNIFRVHPGKNLTC